MDKRFVEDSILYKIASCIWRNTVLRWVRGYRISRDRNYWKEKKKHGGKENPDKTFYVIRRRDMYVGLFSHFFTILVHIDQEIKNGRIPVVDMQNSFNLYLTSEQIGKVNAWEFYFKQPCGYGLNDIKRSKNIIIGSGAVPVIFPYWKLDFLTGKSGELAYWRGIAKQYIRLSDKAEAILQKAQKLLFLGGEEKRFLGYWVGGQIILIKNPSCILFSQHLNNYWVRRKKYLRD